MSADDAQQIALTCRNPFCEDVDIEKVLLLAPGVELAICGVCGQDITEKRAVT
jgi:hypothetical protein